MRTSCSALPCRMIVRSTLPLGGRSPELGRTANLSRAFVRTLKATACAPERLMRRNGCDCCLSKGAAGKRSVPRGSVRGSRCAKS